MNFGKKIAGFAALGLLTFFVSTSTVYADSIAVISGDSVNVRLEPNTNSQVLKQYNGGESVDIISIENGWYKIKESSQPSGYAYVTGEYVMIVQVDGTVNNNRINIREKASTESTVLGTLNQGDVISITGSEGDFYSFDMNGATRYIYKGYVDGSFLSSVQEQEYTEVIQITAEATPLAFAASPAYTYGEIRSANGVNFRKGPSPNADIIFALPYDDIVDIIDASGEWLHVSYAGIEGYVKADFVELKTGTKPDRNARTIKANAIISFARKYIGTPYVWGGTNLNRGVDCSGFTYSVFKNFGYSLNRTSRDQIYNGDRVKRANLLPGDLVFFDTNGTGSISHVGIYIGDGQFIHSSSGKKTMSVTINSLYETYYDSRYIGACRIIY